MSVSTQPHFTGELDAYVGELAITTDGTLNTFGRNSHGQLGNGDVATADPTPGPVILTGDLTGATFTAIDGGGYHTLAVTTDGRTAGFGRNNHGQVGNNSNTDQHVPVPTTLQGQLTGTKSRQIAAGSFHSLAR